MRLMGLDPLRAVSTIRGLPWYLRDLRTLKVQAGSAEAEFPLGELHPCLGDRSAESGVASGHYFHQDLLVARRVFAGNPSIHLDVGSRIDGFVAHVAAFRSIQVIDIRPMTSPIPSIQFIQCDVMRDIPESFVDYCDSLSCLHALEHFGLGRYGDPVRFDGYVVGLGNLAKIVRQGGKFYLSLPIGPQRIEFNAHRVFSVRYLLELVRPRFKIDSFSFVDDQGDLHEGVDLTEREIARDFACHFGCGIFEMTRWN